MPDNTHTVTLTRDGATLTLTCTPDTVDATLTGAGDEEPVHASIELRVLSGTYGTIRVHSPKLPPVRRARTIAAMTAIIDDATSDGTLADFTRDARRTITATRTASAERRVDEAIAAHTLTAVELHDAIKAHREASRIALDVATETTRNPGDAERKHARIHRRMSAALTRVENACFDLESSSDDVPRAQASDLRAALRAVLTLDQECRDDDDTARAALPDDDAAILADIADSMRLDERLDREDEHLINNVCRAYPPTP